MKANLKINSLENTIEICLADGKTKGYLMHELPQEFIDWQLELRKSMFQRIKAQDFIPNFHAHLPVMATMNPNGQFPIHMATKGTGFLPKDEFLSEYIELFQDCLEQSKLKTWKESLPDRVAVMQDFYNYVEKIDFRKLGFLEIFRGRTYRNILANPTAAVQFNGQGPQYSSYQINGIAQVVDSKNLCYRFIYLARQLFEYESFHIQQPQYPCGYIFWVCEVYNKSPRGKAGKRVI